MRSISPQRAGDAVEITASPEALARRAAEWLVATLSAAPGPCAVALSGGTTPRRLYEIMAGPPYRDAMPWQRVHWFWGDERLVPPDDPRSNYRLVHETLLSRVPAPAANIHAVPTTGLTPEEAAKAYERKLRSYYGAEIFDPGRPLFEATILGLGEDGHTASLFPGTAILEERRRWVGAVIGAQAEPRISLTYPALSSSRQVAFLVSGEKKRNVVARLHGGDRSLPAARLDPVGRIYWFLDAAATEPAT